MSVNWLRTATEAFPVRRRWSKLIHGSNFSPKDTRDLMMKTSTRWEVITFRKKNSRLNVLYQDMIRSATSTSSTITAPTSKVFLLSLFNLDDLNSNLDPQPDGVFYDFVQGVTINTPKWPDYFPCQRAIWFLPQREIPELQSEQCWPLCLRCAIMTPRRPARSAITWENKFSLKGKLSILFRQRYSFECCKHSSRLCKSYCRRKSAGWKRRLHGWLHTGPRKNSEWFISEIKYADWN